MSEIKTGTKIESEHKGTVEFITEYLRKNGKLPNSKDIYTHIAKDHIEGSDNEEGVKDYYTRLLAMEDSAKSDKKRPKIETDAINFLLKNPNPSDKKLHGYAEKIGHEHSVFEEAVYKLATERALESKDMQKAKYIRRIPDGKGGYRYIYKDNQKKKAAPIEEKPKDVTQTPEFKKWFGDSKVVDKNGKPLVVYHGTGEDFSEFKEGYTIKGQFFTDQKEEAMKFAEGGVNPHVKESFLKMENPKTIDFEGKLFDFKKVNSFVTRYKSDGYDGVIIRNIKNFPNGTTTDTYITFSPNQIKSATHNSGSFDPNSNNMMNANTMKKSVMRIFDNLFVRVPMEKVGKPQPIGTTATWADGKTYRKVSDSNWEPISGGDHTEKKHDASPSGGSGKKDDVSTPSKLHEKFNDYMQGMSTEHRSIFRGGVMDFEKKTFTAPNKKVALKYNDGKISVIKLEEMKKASDNMKNKVMEYLTKHPKPKDETEYHKFAETIAKEHGIAEETAYEILGDLLAGGKSKGKKLNVDPKELAMGIKVEYEHTKDSKVAEKIARDHLVEIPDYYTRLAKMEKEASMQKAKYIRKYRVGNKWKYVYAENKIKEKKQETQKESSKEEEEDDSYKMQHQPPRRDDDVVGSGHDLTDIFPDDIYSPNGLKYYGRGFPSDAKAISIIKEMRGNPEKEVTIYRAVPKNVDNIRKNNWVSITKEYADQHGKSNLNGDYKILSKKVKAKDLLTNGDSIQEWGYSPDESDMQKARKMPIGTISKGYKKVAEGKWVKVKEQSKKQPVKPVDVTDTPEFKKWFGDSKVVDKDGKPMVVYKGMMKKDWRSGEEIKEINSPSGPWAGFFSSDKEVAKGFEKTFSTMGEAITLESYIKMENPFIVDAKGGFAKDFMFDNIVFGKEPKNKEAFDALTSGKYDGVIIKNTKDEKDVFVPIKPNQIKSVSNKNFDSNSSDMTKAVKNNNPYPLKTEKDVRSAISHFAMPRNNSQYDSKEKKVIAKKIISAAKKYEIDISSEWEKLFGVDKPMKKAFVKIMDGMFVRINKSVNVKSNLDDMQKARPTKYISRKRVKDHWEYTYADTKGGSKGGGMLDSILSFFGFKGKEEATAKIKQTYEKHKEELGGMGFSTFTSYLAEYLKNKTKWDAKLSGAKKESSEPKKDSKPKGDKTPVMPHKDKKESFSLSVMKKVAGLVNEIKSAKPEPSEGKKDGKSESKDNFETMPDKEEFTYDGYLKDKETGQRLEFPNQSMANLIEKKYKEKGIDVEKIRTRQGTYVFSLKDGKTKDDLKQIQSLEEQFRNNSTQELKEMLDPDSYKTKPANYEAQMAAVRNVLKEREEDDAQNIRDKQREESIKTQEWTKTSIDKSNVKYYNGTKIDPKDIKDSFSVWGKTIAVVKNKYGSFDTIELSTGLTVSKNHDTQKKSIEIAKNALGINGKEKFLSAINNAEKINNFDTMPKSAGDKTPVMSGEKTKQPSRKRGTDKQEFVDSIKNYIGINLVNDKDDRLNQRRNYLYTEIPEDRKTPIMSRLNELGITPEKHMGNKYWLPLSKEIIDRAVKINDTAAEMSAINSEKKLNSTGDKSASMSGVTGKDLNKPWEMTRDEWNKEKDALKFDTGEYGSSKLGIGKSKTGAEKNAETRKTITEALNFGMSKESDLRPLPENMARLNNRVDHADIIYKALKEGKKVPDNILSEYKNEPEFKKLLAQNQGDKSTVMSSKSKKEVKIIAEKIAENEFDNKVKTTGDVRDSKQLMTAVDEFKKQYGEEAEGIMLQAYAKKLNGLNSKLYREGESFREERIKNKEDRSSVMSSTNDGDTLKNNVETLNKEVAKLAKDERDPKTGEMSQKYYDTLSKFNEARDKLNSFLEGKSKEKLNSPEYKAQQKTLEEAQKLKDKMKEREASVTSSTYEKSKKRLEKQAETNMSASKRGAGSVSQGDKTTLMSKALDLLMEDLQKAKKMPIGTVSNGRKKVAEGKWEPVGEGKDTGKKPEPAGDKEKKPEDKKKPANENKEAMREKIKTALKGVANVLSEALAGRGGGAAASQNVEKTGESIEKTGDKKNKENENKKKEDENKKKEDENKKKEDENKKKQNNVPETGKKPEPQTKGVKK